MNRSSSAPPKVMRVPGLVSAERCTGPEVLSRRGASPARSSAWKTLHSAHNPVGGQDPFPTGSFATADPAMEPVAEATVVVSAGGCLFPLQAAAELRMTAAMTRARGQ